MGKSLLSYCDKSCILNFLCYVLQVGPTSFVRDRRARVLQVGSTGKRSKPALNKNGGCLYIVAIVSEKKINITHDRHFTHL